MIIIDDDDDGGGDDDKRKVTGFQDLFFFLEMD